MPRLPCAILLASTALAATPASAAISETQAWATQSVAIRADRATIVTLDSSQRARADAASGGEQFLVRGTIDHAIAPGVQLGGGIAWLKSEGDQEMRLFQQATLAKGIWTARTRMEQRFFDNADTASWRLRQRVQAAIPIDSAKQWTLIAATELMFHLNRARARDRTGLATMRHQIGLRHPIGKGVDAQILYMRQHTFRDARPDVVVHVPWLTLNWRI